MSAELAKAMRALNDMRAIERDGVHVAALVAGRLRQGALRQYRTGRHFSPYQIIMGELKPILKKAMMVGHALGVRRSKLLIKESRRGIALAVFDDVLRAIAKRKELDIELLAEQYEVQAFKILTGHATKIDQKIQEVIDELISSGSSVREATEVLGETFAKLGIAPGSESQLETLFRTQLQTSFGAGRWEADQDPDVQEILWGYKYVTVGDDRVREEHELLEGVTLPKDDPFWDENWPPNGWNCRCIPIPIFEEREVKEPPDEYGGPDDGFDFNAGQVFSGALQDGEEEGEEFAFNPDQPRNPDGTWGEGGGSFPKSNKGLKTVKSLGGTTGTKLVKDEKTGKQYVEKTGKSPAHAKSEYAVNRAYEALGVDVPEGAMTEEGTLLNEFIEDAVTFGELDGDKKEAASLKLRQHFVADAVLGNWDAIGMLEDNILVGPDGDVTRTDNGGSLSFRAQGGLKGAAWNEKVSELDTLRDPKINPQAAKVYGKLTDKEIETQALEVIEKSPAAVQALKDAGLDKDAAIVEQRVQTLKDRFKTQPTTSSPAVYPSYMGKKLNDRLNVLKSDPTTSKELDLQQMRKIVLLNNGADQGTLVLPNTLKPSEVAAVEKLWPGKTVKMVDSKKALAAELTKYGSKDVAGVWKGKLTDETKGAAAVAAKTAPAADKSFYDVVAAKPSSGPAKAVKPITSTPKGAAPPPLPLVQMADGDWNLEDTVKGNYSTVKTKAWGDKLSEDERGAISGWKGSAKPIRETQLHPDKASPTALAREKAWTAALDKGVKYEGTVFRGVSHVKPGSEFYEALTTPGSVIEFNTDACSSRSSSEAIKRGTSKQGGAVYRISTVSGVSIEDVEGFKNEREVVIRRASRYRVTNVIKNAATPYTMGKIPLLVDLQEVTDVPTHKLTLSFGY